MKVAKNKSLGAIKSLKPVLSVFGLMSILLANNAGAAVQGWNPNGTVSIGGDGTWDTTSPVWTPGGTQTQVDSGSLVPFTPGNAALFCAGPSASANQGTFTITVSGAISIGGIFNGNLNPGPCNVTITGGELSLAPGTDAFSMFNDVTTINTPISGTGVLNPQGSGSVSLYASNWYSGGTLLNGPTLVNFNNNNSFGTGTITITRNSGLFAALLGTLGAPITLPNNFANTTSGGGVNFGTSANTPITSTGNWSLGAANLNLRNNGNSTAPLTLSGIVSGTASLTLSANNNGLITLSGANTYSGQTLISGGSSGVTLSVSSLNSVSGGGPSSNLGHPTTVANGTIAIGSGANTCTLLYSGPGETSDRVVNLAGTTGGARLQADGTGALVLTAVNTATGAGAKTLTLQGSNTGANSIGKIVNSSGASAVVKAQAGSWKLTGANTFTGGTTVNAGTLEISGSVAGNVTNNSGILTLDTSSSLSANATVAASSGTTINLNFTGTNTINALIIDGAAQLSGVWGPPGSAAPNQNAIFAGTGYINILGKPVIVQQPVSGSVFLGDVTSFTFSIGVVGDLSTVTYQWKQNGVNIPGATSSSYPIPSPVAAGSAGNYSCAVTNAFGFATSAGATLYVMSTNAYTEMIRGDSPVSYWRLDETNGTVAYDPLGSNNGLYNNVTLNQSGYAVTDSDPAIGVPGSGSPRGYMQVTNVTPFVINGGSVFTLECWAYFTNLTTKGRFFSTLNLSAPNGYAFGVLPGGTALEFTSGAIFDNDTPPLASPLVTGQWYHLACTCDGNNYTFYVNGAPVGVSAVTGHAPNGTANRLQLGANPPSYTIGGGDGGAEQVYGRIDEAAFYPYALSQTQVTNHFIARYATLAPPIVFAPVVNPPTNYQSLSATLQADAAGTDLSYQWYKAPSTLLSGKTDATLTLSPLQLSDGGNYFVQVSNPAGTSNSPTSTLTVLPIPSDASQLNVTNGLVLHLPFDTDFSDISGRGNDGTNMGASLIAVGAVGAQALHYETAIAPGATNYVTLGVRPDLKFSSNVDFTVSYWVRQPNGSTYTNLPFFGDAINSTGSGSGGNRGFVFAPYQTAISAGGWQVAIGGSSGSMSTPSQFTSFPDSDLINDGNWHHLVQVATRAANVATYLDGTQVDSEAISFVGDISNTNAATIGQDPTGAYPVAAGGDIDDLGVWRRTLTPLEVSGIYLAGATNHVSFAPPVNPIVRAALQIVQVSPGQYQIIWPGGGTLQASGDVIGTYTNVPSGTSPYTIPVSSSPQLFYRLKY